MKGFKFAAVLGVVAMTALLLSGCLYPQNQLEQNRMPAKDAILSVQAVVDQYEKDTGLLPIENADQDTPVYEKYKIDFAKLQRMNYLSEIPATAYEKGGSYYYLIINEETDPTVKLMNLAIYQQLNDLAADVKAYADAHGGSLPAGGQAYPDFRYVDFKLLGKKEPVMRSMFTGQTLSAMMDAQGKVYLDYGSDIAQSLGKAAAGSRPPADLRELLVNESDFVPVKSPVYRLVDGEPQASPDKAATG